MKENQIQVPINIDERQYLKDACKKILGVELIGFHGDDAVIRFDEPWNLFYLGQQFYLNLIRSI